MYKLSILVVLYNKSISESKTLKSLSSLSVKNDKVKLVVWNNGPESIKEQVESTLSFEGFDFKIIETLHNESLAKIYNTFVNNKDSSSYLILDHDSILDQNYLNAAINSSTYDLLLPIIMCKDVIRAPFINKEVYKLDMAITSSDNIVSIGSGLIIGAGVLDNMREKYHNVFDERFYLYGVDTSFFKRLNNSKNDFVSNIKVISPIEHSLSRFECEDNSISKFRDIERSYDFGLSLRYYTPVYKLPLVITKQVMIMMLNKLTRKKKTYIFKLVAIAFFTGKHYRAK